MKGSIFSYFDLNERAQGGKKREYRLSATSMERTTKGAEPGEGADGTGKMSASRQITMYVGIFAGVLLSSLVNQFQKGEIPNLTLPTAVVLVVSAVIALILSPVVYEKLQLKPNLPFIVQLGLFVQNGVFWQVLLATIGKAM